jgi:hypothetical protein
MDDEIMPLGLARDRFIDRGIGKLVAFWGAQVLPLECAHGSRSVEQAGRR